MVHIPYKGLAPGMVDLLAGHVTVATATMLTGLPHVRSGRLRCLGTTGAKRAAVLPDMPTVAEAGVPGYEASQWYGAPRAGADAEGHRHAAARRDRRASCRRRT